MTKSEIYKETLREANVAEGNLTDEYLSTIEKIDGFYFNGEMDGKTIKEGFTDGNRDGGIDFIFNRDGEIYIVQGKTGSRALQEIKNDVNKVIEAIDNFNNNNYTKYNERVKKSYILNKNAAQKFKELYEEGTYNIVVFIGNELTTQQRKELNYYFAKEEYEDYNVVIYDENDWCEQKKKLWYGDEYVKEAKLKMLKDTSGKHNYATYEMEDGKKVILLFASAFSIQDLYNSVPTNQLLRGNTRGYFKNKVVDDGIVETIKEAPDTFAAKNNGSIYYAKRCLINEETGEVILKNTTIPNGGQSTTKIGTIESDVDYGVVVKIICCTLEDGENDGFTEEEKEFLQEVSLASNTSKEMKNTDLLSNNKVIIDLKYSCENSKYPVCIKMKTGVDDKNDKNIPKGTKVIKPDDLAKYLIKMVKQNPWTSYGGIKNIVTNKAKVNELFPEGKEDRYSAEMIRDIVDILEISKEQSKERKSELSHEDFVKAGWSLKEQPLTDAAIYHLALVKNNLVSRETEEETYIDFSSRAGLKKLFNREDYTWEEIKENVKIMRQIIQEEVEQLKRREGSEKTWNVFIKNSKKDYYRLRNELDNILSKPTSFRSRELMEAMKVLAVEENC